METDTHLLMLNVLLLILATVTAASAIGGETWLKDQPSFFKSITKRGWASLICAVLTLGVGVGKEILAGHESSKQQAKNDQLQGTVDSQVKQIAELRAELKAAYKKIQEDQKTLVEAESASQKTTDAIQAYVYDRLSSATYSYVGVLGRMIAEASDGWLPSNKTEFFSRRSVNLLCRWLNAEGNAPVYPARPWYRYFHDESKQYEDRVIDILNAYAGRLAPALIDSLSEVARSSLLGLPKQFPIMYAITKKPGFKGSPMICLSIFDNKFEEAFIQLSGLVNQIAKAEKTFRLQSRMDNKLLLSGLRSVTLGANRLTETEAKRFLESQTK